MAANQPEAWLVEAARERVHEFASQVRAADPSQRVPNLDWTVADLAQHVACLPGFWTEQHQGGDTFELPDDFAAFSDSKRAWITTTVASELADLIESGFDGFLTELASCDETFWLYGSPQNATNLCALTVNETILHGRDLAAVTGVRPPMHDDREVHAVVNAMMATTPAFIDPVKAAAQPDGVYHVHFRGGDHWTWTKRGPELIVTPGKPPKADAHMRADAATFLLASLGRISQVRAGLSGKMLTYGKKPWRFLGLGTMAVDGV